MATRRIRASTNGANRKDNGTNRKDRPDIQSGTYTLPETARRLGIGTTTVYDLVKRGEPPFGPDGPIPIHQIGAQKRTLVAEVERYLAGQRAS